ncbi:MAG: hypothetical protein NC483_01940 [Ruminococcus sp.]|nr:hypothetical protein [Ruminococcus sp.]
MYNLIKRYMANLTKDDINNFATSKNVVLNTEELDFIFEFVKKNWEQVLNNPKLLNLDRYKNRFNEENFIKIKKLFNEYSAKYQNFL